MRRIGGGEEKHCRAVTPRAGGIPLIVEVGEDHKDEYGEEDFNGEQRDFAVSGVGWSIRDVFPEPVLHRVMLVGVHDSDGQ